MTQDLLQRTSRDLCLDGCVTISKKKLYIPKIGKFPNLWEFSIPNDALKFSHFSDHVPVRGCVRRMSWILL